jgi:hypothetical protein
VVKSRMYRAFALSAFALGTPALLAAQEAASAPTQHDLEAIFAEFQEIHHQLEDIQLQALQDPQLNAAQEALGEEIRTAMEARDPALRQQMERIESLEGEAVSAQQAGNLEKLQELMVEAQAIEQRFLTIQQQVLTTPSIAAKIEAFQTELERKMVEVNPQTASLISRFRELESKLSTAMQGGA